MNPIYVSKTLAIASSNAFGTISSATPPVVTLNTSNVDTARRVILSATADFSATFIISGKGQYGNSITETVVGSTQAGSKATTQDFLSLSAVSVSAALGIPLQIGTNTQGGTPWQLVDRTRNPCAVGCALVLSSTGVAASAEYTLDDPTGSYPSLNQVPVSIISTALSTVAALSQAGIISLSGSQYIPITAWRITMTSTATGAGTLNATVLQSG